MRTLRKKYLSEIGIDENVYKADFNILEKYQGFSAEVLRLSLLGLAVYGFMITNVFFKIKEKNALAEITDLKHFFVAGGILLLIASTCALAHRYFSSDCMTHHIRRLRLTKRIDELTAIAAEQGYDLKQEPPLDMEEDENFPVADRDLTVKHMLFRWHKFKDVIKQEDKSYESDLALCKWLLIAAVLCLVLGIAFALGSFSDFLFSINFKI